MSNFQLPAGFKPSAAPGGGGNGGGGQSSEEQQAAMERAAAQEEMKRGMISAMLEPEARERCKRCTSLPSFLHLKGNGGRDTDCSIADLTHTTADGSASDRIAGEDGSTRANQRQGHG